MTNLQIYIIESLFCRGQITRQQLINAIETLPNDIERNKFISALLPQTESLQKPQKRKTKLNLIDIGNSKLQTVKTVKELLGFSLAEAKKLVDDYPVLIDLRNCPNQNVDVDELTYQLQYNRVKFTLF